MVELRATGMPLGLLADMRYESREATLAADQSVVLYSDGIIEAHGPDGDMFGFPRLRELMTADLGGSEIIDAILDQLHAFTGSGWEQEDDITMVALRRDGMAAAVTGPPIGRATDIHDEAVDAADAADQASASFTWSSPASRATSAWPWTASPRPSRRWRCPEARLERLKTAVSEATMNAIEYGSRNDPAIPVEIDVNVSSADLIVRITDQGLSGATERPRNRASRPSSRANRSRAAGASSSSSTWSMPWRW